MPNIWQSRKRTWLNTINILQNCDTRDNFNLHWILNVEDNNNAACAYKTIVSKVSHNK